MAQHKVYPANYRTGQLYPAKAVEHLEAGDIVQVWWLCPPQPIESRTVRSVAVQERPGYKHNSVKVVFQDGSVLRDVTTDRFMLVGAKIQFSRKD